MLVRYKGTSPVHNGDLGYVEPDKTYEVPKEREMVFLINGDYEIISELEELKTDKPKLYKSKSLKDE